MENNGNKEIWVFADLRNERLLGLSLNVLAKARELAADLGSTVAAVLAGLPESEPGSGKPGVEFPVTVDEGANTCLRYGADVAYVLENRELGTPRADIYGEALAKAVSIRAPKLVLFALTDFGRELASRTARLNNGGLIADCADLRIEKGAVVAACPAWGGEIMAQIAFTDDNLTGFATVHPHICQAMKIPGKGGTIQRVPVEGFKVSKGLKLVASSLEPMEHRKLEDADIVVVGGAGLGSTEGFGEVRELAAALGGEVGATRPPVLQHWVDEDRLIGQTGKAVRPRLLLSIGTSGAVQYTAGIMGAETIVAINRDQHATVFQVADLGIVADWKSIVPLLIRKAKYVVMRNLADAMSVAGDVKAKTGFGAKVSELRKAQNWSQEDLAQTTGESPEFISQIERDEIAPPVSFLLKLAKSLDVDPSSFLREEEKAAIQDSRAQAFVKRTGNYSYETLTPGAENENLRAFLITIEPRQDHKPVAYKHEGEEFIFVLDGDLELTLGTKTHHLKRRESIRFNSDISHKLKSRSDEITRCLVVLYTP